MIRKIYIFLTMSFCISTDFLQADRFNSICCADSFCCDDSHYCHDSYYCDGLFDHFFLRGDLLIWKPQVTGLEFNFGSSSITQENVDSTLVYRTNEHDFDPKGKWSPGFRLGVGYRCPTPQWEMEVLWTDFHGRADKSSKGNSSGSNKGKYRVRLDQIDGIVSYNTALTHCITIKPFLGVRGAQINQNVHARLITNIVLASSAVSVETKKVKDKQKYFGIGPLIGLHADLDMGCGWGIYGTAAAGLMYGNFKVHFDDSDIFTAPISKDVYYLDKRSLHSLDCNIDLALGLSWHTYLDDCVEIDLRLGLELHDYFNQNRMSISRGDLNFNGGVFSAVLGF